MAKSALNESLREAQQRRFERLTVEERSVRAAELAQQGVRDFASTHKLSYGEARKRLKDAANAARTRKVQDGD